MWISKNQDAGAGAGFSTGCGLVLVCPVLLDNAVANENGLFPFTLFLCEASPRGFSTFVRRAKGLHDFVVLAVLPGDRPAGLRANAVDAGAGAGADFGVEGMLFKVRGVGLSTVFSAIRDVLDDLTGALFIDSSRSSVLRFRLLDWWRFWGSMFSVSIWMSVVYFAGLGVVVPDQLAYSSGLYFYGGVPFC